MYIGTQVAPRNLSDLEVWSQLGVNNIWTAPFRENEKRLSISFDSDYGTSR